MLRADYYSKDEQGLYNLNVVFNILFDDLSKTIVNSLLTNCINKLTDQKFLTAIIRRRRINLCMMKFTKQWRGF